MKTENHMGWLEEHMRSRVKKQPLNDDLGILTRAAKTMRDTEDRASKSQARAQTMVTHAAAELKIAERMLQESEAARIEAEAEQRRALAKVKEVERSLDARTEQVRRIQLEAEQRCKAAEQRARDTEDELRALREAITVLFGDSGAPPAFNIAAE